MEEGRVGRWRNEGGEAGMGEHGLKEGEKEVGRTERVRNEEGGEMKEEAGRGEHEVRGSEGGMEGREGDVCRGRAWSE